MGWGGDAKTGVPLVTFWTFDVNAWQLRHTFLAALPCECAVLGDGGRIITALVQRIGVLIRLGFGVPHLPFAGLCVGLGRVRGNALELCFVCCRSIVKRTGLRRAFVLDYLHLFSPGAVDLADLGCTGGLYRTDLRFTGLFDLVDRGLFRLPNGFQRGSACASNGALLLGPLVLDIGQRILPLCGNVVQSGLPGSLDVCKSVGGILG